MKVRLCGLAALAMLAGGCASPPPAPVAQVEVEKPADETRRFPLANRVETHVVATALLGKPFMPGGTLAHYKRGAAEYDMFVAKLPTPLAAGLLLPDWKNALTDAHVLPTFGGYFGNDGGRPVFVFAKGVWIAGVAGLPQKQADLEARTLAARLD
jgi:hypothetical protein